jgi:hypothetical protein
MNIDDNYRFECLLLKQESKNRRAYKMRIATLQFDAVLGKVSGNIERATSLLSSNNDRLEDLDLLVLPELAFTGKFVSCIHQRQGRPSNVSRSTLTLTKATITSHMQTLNHILSQPVADHLHYGHRGLHEISSVWWQLAILKWMSRPHTLKRTTL